MERVDSRRRAWAWFLVFAAAVAWQIFPSPPIGLADNGDFAKMIGRHSLRSAVENDFNSYAASPLLFDDSYHWESQNVSIERLLIAPMASLARLWNPREFDIRWMGAIHFAILLPAVWLALDLLRSSLAASFVAVFALTDVLYVSHLNSFYTDTAGLLFLLWTTVTAARLLLAPSPFRYAAFVAATLALMFSKSQHAIAALAFCAVAIRAVFVMETKILRMGAAVGAAGLILAVAGASTLIPGEERAQALFSAVFSKVLGESHSVAADLRELALEPDDARYAGLYAYSPNSPLDNPAWRERFPRRMNHFRLLMFYLRHPLRTAGFIANDLRVPAAEMRSASLGNYPRQAGRPPGAQAWWFGWWSGLRMAAIRLLPVHLVVWPPLALAAAALLWRRTGPGAERRMIELFAAITLFAVIEFGIATLADNCETSRHLFLYHASTDIALVAGVRKITHLRAA